MELPNLLYLNSVVTKARVHDSQAFEEVFTGLPPNVKVRRTLADAAYSGDPCLHVVRDAGATPLHDITSNARWVTTPESACQKLVDVSLRWTNRIKSLTGRRSLVETAFSVTKGRFGERLRCRTKVSRHNEIMAKHIAHDIRILARGPFAEGAWS